MPAGFFAKHDKAIAHLAAASALLDEVAAFARADQRDAGFVRRSVTFGSIRDARDQLAASLDGLEQASKRP